MFCTPVSATEYISSNCYCTFNHDMSVVQVAEELTQDCDTDLEKVNEIYKHIVYHFKYDHLKAQQVKQGKLQMYTPDVEALYEKGMGICYDYSSVMSAMLRSQGIPCKVVFGYAYDIWHAWVSVNIDGEWVSYDPTFASSSAYKVFYTMDTDKYIVVSEH